MLRKMTAKQLRRWQAFFAIERAGEDRADARMAYLVRAMYELKRDPKKMPEPFKVNMFMHDFLKEIGELPPTPKQTPEQKKAILLEALMQAAHEELTRPPQILRR